MSTRQGVTINESRCAGAASRVSRLSGLQDEWARWIYMCGI